LGFEMAARAAKEGIKIRDNRWPDNQYVKWSDGYFYNQDSISLDSSILKRLQYLGWEEYKEPEVEKIDLSTKGVDWTREKEVFAEFSRMVDEKLDKFKKEMEGRK